MSSGQALQKDKPPAEINLIFRFANLIVIDDIMGIYHFARFLPSWTNYAIIAVRINAEQSKKVEACKNLY